MSIGKVAVLNGEVKAISLSGEERILQVGDTVKQNEQIITGGNGRVAITFNDGESQLVLGRNSEALIDKDVFDPEFDPNSAFTENSASVEDIQAALEADPNFDPTAELEATAAGAGGQNGESSGEPAVVAHELLSVNFDFLDTLGPQREQEVDIVDDNTDLLFVEGDTEEPFIPEDTTEAVNEDTTPETTTDAVAEDTVPEDDKIVFMEVNQMAGPLPFEGDDCHNMNDYYTAMFDELVGN